MYRHEHEHDITDQQTKIVELRSLNVSFIENETIIVWNRPYHQVINYIWFECVNPFY